MAGSGRSGHPRLAGERLELVDSRRNSEDPEGDIQRIFCGPPQTFVIPVERNGNPPPRRQLMAQSATKPSFPACRLNDGFRRE